MPQHHYSSDVPASPRHDPNAAPRKRDALIQDVSRELKRRHGGNEVLNQLEAEILVDHFIEQSDRRRDDAMHTISATEIIHRVRGVSA